MLLRILVVLALFVSFGFAGAMDFKDEQERIARHKILIIAGIDEY